jgi:acyl carrier protein
VLQEVKSILGEALGLGERVNSFTEDTVLLGSIAELDSMAVVSLITSIEEYYGIVIDDDEINAETFETVGTLCEFVRSKVE